MKICFTCSKKFNEVSWKCPHCFTEPTRVDGFLCFAPELAIGSTGFKASFFEPLSKLEKNNFWFQSRNKLIIWALKMYFPRAENLLEIGCGTGFVLSAIDKTFPWMSLNGSDIYVEGLAFAKKRLKAVSIFQLDARNIPFEEEYDVIGSFDVLEHIKEDEMVLSQMYRATKKGGGIIISVPQHPFLWSKIDEFSFHKRRYKSKELKEKVENAGFKVIMMTSFVTFLLPVMMFSRMIKRNESDYDPLHELKISGLKNKILKTILDIERFIIRLGLSLPIGGSLLIVAYKK